MVRTCYACARDLKIDGYVKPLTANYDFNSLVFEFRSIRTVFYIKIEA